jgi:sugar transferase (PEP-CTERM system associated)
MGQLFRDYARGRSVALWLSEALLVVACYLAASYVVQGEEWQVFLLLDSGLAQIGFTAAVFLIGAYFVGLYDRIRVESRVYLIQQFCLAMGIAFLAQAASQYVRLPLGLPRRVMLLGSVSCLVLLPAWRVLYGGLILRSLPKERILFIGASPTVRELISHLSRHSELGLQCVGCVLPEEQQDAEIPCAFLGPLSRLREAVEETKPDRLVVGLAERRRTLPIYELLDLRFSGVRIDEVASLYERVFRRVCINELRPSELVFTSNLGPQRHNLQLQALYSTLIALAGILLTWPLMILAAVAVKLSSPGPILFRQTRVGWQDRPFTLYKFRSMQMDAEAETGAVWAQENDPRVTRLGRWLRLLRFDELPQLINVLRGEMAIVGPRPERPEFVKNLKEQIPFYNQRHSVKPGITGWAQISYGYASTFDDAARKLEYDLHYIKNVSAWLDFYIMFHTLRTMLTGRGAK